VARRGLAAAARGRLAARSAATTTGKARSAADADKGGPIRRHDDRGGRIRRRRRRWRPDPPLRRRGRLTGRVGADPPASVLGRSFTAVKEVDPVVDNDDGSRDNDNGYRDNDNDGYGFLATLLARRHAAVPPQGASREARSRQW
jgi:hypothetical protein